MAAHRDTARLTPGDVEAIARRVLELVEDLLLQSRDRYVDAAGLAEMLGVERDWVYAHSAELGGVRLGGPRGRLRFDVRHVDEVLAQTRASRKERGARFQRVALLDYER